MGSQRERHLVCWIILLFIYLPWSFYAFSNGSKRTHWDAVRRLVVTACQNCAERRAIPSMREHARDASFGKVLDGRACNSDLKEPPRDRPRDLWEPLAATIPVAIRTASGMFRDQCKWLRHAESSARLQPQHIGVWSSPKLHMGFSLKIQNEKPIYLFISTHWSAPHSRERERERER